LDSSLRASIVRRDLRLACTTWLAARPEFDGREHLTADRANLASAAAATRECPDRARGRVARLADPRNGVGRELSVGQQLGSTGDSATDLTGMPRRRDEPAGEQ